MRRRGILAAGAGVAALLVCSVARAEISDGVVRIGVLTDMSSLYADNAGKGSLRAAQMAAEDFAASHAGAPKVEILSGDHLNKPDVGAAIARQWMDVEKVDAIVDVPNSGVALAVNEAVRGRHAAYIASSPVTSDLTGKFCSPNTVQWTYDSFALGAGTASTLLKQGDDTWFFLASDNALGHSFARDTGSIVTAKGGKVLGEIQHPINTADFSSFLLQAQGSKAKVIALASAGGDVVSAVKQAAEFGIGESGQVLAGLLVTIHDVHTIGLEAAQGLVFSEPFYWNLNDRTRSWSKRFAERNGGDVPTSAQAGVYSSVLAYLDAVSALHSDDGPAVVKEMKAHPIDDALFGTVTIEANGRAIHDMYVYRPKKPGQSTGPWDLYDLVATVPAEEAFRSAEESGCALSKMQ